jgi:hypothetical protein
LTPTKIWGQKAFLRWLVFISEIELNTLFLKKQIIDDKTLLLWLVLSVFSVIGFIVTGSIIVFIVYGCWPLHGFEIYGGGCLSRVASPYLYLLPCVLGVVVGTVLTKKITRKPHGNRG